MTGSVASELLRTWREGDPTALNRLVALVHSELRRVAGWHFQRERAGHTLQPTALVNELYLRLLGETNIRWSTRAEFLGIASRQMREILVDHARSRNANKRGGRRAHVLVDDELGLAVDNDPVGILALEQAFDRLARLDKRCSEVAELRVYGGLGIDEVAAALGLSRSTVEREWRIAKMCLKRELAAR